MFSSHLWRDVVRGAAEGARGHAFVHVLLAHAEIRDLDVALGVQHYVVQLQIPTVETCLFCFFKLVCRRFVQRIGKDSSLSALLYNGASSRNHF